MIDVLLPTKGEHRYLEIALKSLQEQTYKNFNVLILDDSRLPQHAEYIKSVSCSDPRFKVVSMRDVCNQDSRLAQILNAGLKISTHEYIARQDDDDFSLPNRFEHQIHLLESGVDVCGTQGIYVDQHSRFKYTTMLPVKPDDINAYMWFANPFLHTSVMFRRNIIETIGVYDPKLIHGQDLDLWNRASMANFRLKNSKKVLVVVRIRRDSVTGQTLFQNSRISSHQIVARRRGYELGQRKHGYLSALVHLPSLRRSPVKLFRQFTNAPTSTTRAAIRIIFRNLIGKYIWQKSKRSLSD
jgi:glycosyltransferase involved in cell wall biosynthesis